MSNFSHNYVIHLYCIATGCDKANTPIPHGATQSIVYSLSSDLESSCTHCCPPSGQGKGFFLMAVLVEFICLCLHHARKPVECIQRSQSASFMANTVTKGPGKAAEVMGLFLLQPAQAVRWSHWLLGHAAAWQRDDMRLRDLLPRVATLPLGSGGNVLHPFIPVMFQCSEDWFTEVLRRFIASSLSR